MLVDSHCHLDFDEFADDIDAVMRRARTAGIRRFVTISIRVREAARILAVAERYDDVWCSVGTHPHYAHEEPEVTAADLVHLARHPRVVAIGEAGLDTFYGNAPWDAQTQSLRIHIDAARQTQLPLVIHSVRQDAAMADILVEESRVGAFPVVMHCFSGGRALARTNLELGHFISFSGLLSFDEHAALRELAAELPADRILVETDAPSLAPVPHLGQRNEPAYIRHTVALLASLRGVSETEIAAQTTANFHRAFGKVPRVEPASAGSEPIA